MNELFPSSAPDQAQVIAQLLNLAIEMGASVFVDAVSAHQQTLLFAQRVVKVVPTSCGTMFEITVERSTVREVLPLQPTSTVFKLIAVPMSLVPRFP